MDALMLGKPQLMGGLEAKAYKHSDHSVPFLRMMMSLGPSRACISRIEEGYSPGEV